MQAAQRTIYDKRRKAPSLVLVTRKTRKTKVTSFGRFIFFSFLLAATIFVNLCQRVQMAQDVSDCEKLKALIRVEEVRQEKLVLDVVALKSPERIEKIAVEKFGMIAPTEISYITLPEEIEQADAAMLVQASSVSHRNRSIRGSRSVFPFPSSLVQANAKGF